MTRRDPPARRAGWLARLSRRTRRSFLADLARLAVALAVPRLSWAAGEEAADAKPAGDGASAAPADPILAELLAIAPILVPADETPGMEADDVRAWYEAQRAVEPDEFAKLPAAMAAIDEAVQAVTHRRSPLRALAAAEREAVIAKIFASTHDDPTASYWVRHVALPMMAFFYSSPRGFSVVGYATYKGTALAGDVTSYRRPAVMPGAARATAPPPATPSPPAAAPEQTP